MWMFSRNLAPTTTWHSKAQLVLAPNYLVTKITVIKDAWRKMYTLKKLIGNLGTKCCGKCISSIYTLAKQPIENLRISLAAYSLISS